MYVKECERPVYLSLSPLQELITDSVIASIYPLSESRKSSSDQDNQKESDDMPYTLFPREGVHHFFFFSPFYP